MLLGSAAVSATIVVAHHSLQHEAMFNVKEFSWLLGVRAWPIS
jgi:hypothetical protein